MESKFVLYLLIMHDCTCMVHVVSNRWMILARARGFMDNIVVFTTIIGCSGMLQNCNTVPVLCQDAYHDKYITHVDYVQGLLIIYVHEQP